jgi:DNA repair exonuclease SbcCD ATPase subunit
MLKAQENIMDNLRQKISYYQTQLQKLPVGSEDFKKTAAEVQRLSLEYQRATQYLQDLQNRALQGLDSASINKAVSDVTSYRARLIELEQEFNNLRNTNSVTDPTSGMLTADANKILKERQQILKSINDMLFSVEDAQKKREKEINDIIKKREEIASRIKAQHQAELEALKRKREENDRIRKILSAEENTISSITAKLQVQQARLQKTKIGSAKFDKIADEVQRLSSALEEAKKRIDGATSSAETHKKKARETTAVYREQTTYLDRLIRRMAVYWSISQVSNFLSKVREVTAQFELQRVSLGAIIQSQDKANALFSQIKSFALKSPISILDLTTYVKQVAAYRIETSKLFDTTKRLADVSVGLGVDMQRIVLAYGQVKAATYLRASELRQFTEAGIPLLELLSEKLSEMNGKAVTTGQVMDMISKRMIDFSMVEQIFKDMTDAGGIFYDMQEKQGNTLYGMWAKLGDAASVMYDEIGNTGIVNDSMRWMISALTSLMRNWESWGTMIAATVGGLVQYNILSKAWSVNMKGLAAAEQAHAAAMNELNSATATGNAGLIKRSKLLVVATNLEMKAATATGFWNTVGLKLNATILRIRAAWASFAPSLIIFAAIEAIGALITWINKATKLQRELNNLQEEGAVAVEKSVLGFELLADRAVKAADGSQKQKDALDELHRTYKDMIPVEDMTIEKLRQMKGNYDALTGSIKEYIAQRTLQQQIDKIVEDKGKDIVDAEKEILNNGVRVLKSFGTFGAAGNLSESEIKRFIDGLKSYSEKESLSVREVIESALKDYVGENVKMSDVGGSLSRVEELVNLYRDQSKAIDEVTQKMKSQYSTLGRYSQLLENVDKQMEKAPVSDGTFLTDQQNLNTRIKLWKEAIEKAGVELKDEWYNMVDKVSANDPKTVSSLDLSAIIASIGSQKPILKNMLIEIQKQYNELVPADHQVKVFRDKFVEMATASKVLDKVKSNLMGFNEDMKSYQKKIKDTVSDLADTIKALNAELAITPMVSLEYAAVEDKIKDAEALKNFYEEFLKLLPNYDKKKNSKKTDDPRLGILQEMVSSLKNVNKEYDELQKKEGSTRALEDTKKIYQKTLQEMKSLSKKYNFGLPAFSVPTNTSELNNYLKKIKAAMAKLPKSDKAVLSLQVDIDKATIDDAQKRIEAKLKELKEKIARSKAAKEFFDKIFEQTGDIQASTQIAFSIYGQSGDDLKKQIVEQIQTVFEGVDVSSAINFSTNEVDYTELLKLYDKYSANLIEKNKETAKTIAEQGVANYAKQIEQWQKELAKEKDFEEQRNDIILKYSKQRADIISSNLPQEQKETLLKSSNKKQSEELSAINVKEFKNSDDYVRTFADMTNIATKSLKALRDKLQKVIDTDKTLDPTNMKAYVEAIEKIDEETQSRGFGNVMVQSVKEYISAAKSLSTAKKELADAKADYEANEPTYDADIKRAKEWQAQAESLVEYYKDRNMLDTKAGIAAQLDLNDATSAVAQAEERKAKAAKKVEAAESKVTKYQDQQRRSAKKFWADLQNCASTLQNMSGFLDNIVDMLGISEDSDLGLMFGAASDALSQTAEMMNELNTLQELYNTICSSNPWLAIAAAVAVTTNMLSKWVISSKVKKANKEIEKQQDVLDELQYSYERLEKHMESALGAQYISDYNSEIENLQQQQEAYLKQAEAERSKGKKADEDKIKEYEEAARDAADEIADMQSQIAEQFLGSDITSAAQDFAQAWVDAYKEFSNLTDAMQEQFKDMIDNMVTNQVIAAVMEKALEPTYALINEMNESDFYDMAFWQKLSSTAAAGATAATESASTITKFLEAAGISLKDTSSDLTGLSRDIAEASEESINGLAAGINTQNYYISYVPQISENVATIVQMLSQGGLGTISTSANADYASQQTEFLSHLPNIYQNTSDMVFELGEIREAYNTLNSLLKSVISTKNSAPSKVVYTKTM